MLKAERPDSAEWANRLSAFMASKLSEEHSVNPLLLSSYVAAGIMTMFVNRDANGVVLGAELWCTVHDPVRGGRRIMKRLASVGDLTADIDMYRRAAFDTFMEGVEPWHVK